MKYVVEAGTDAATLVLFDPGALPEDFDTHGREQPGDVLEELTTAGRACQIDIGGDGFYLLHAYVDEPLPDRLQTYVRDPLTMDRLSVPTGRIFFTGAEYAFREDDAFLRDHPHMGGSFEVPRGEYRLTVFRTEYPVRLRRSVLRQHLTGPASWLYLAMGWLAGLAVVAFVALVITFLAMPRNLWLTVLLPVLGGFVCLPIAVSLLKPYREAVRRAREVESEFPSVVALMEFHTQPTP